MLNPNKGKGQVYGIPGTKWEQFDDEGKARLYNVQGYEVEVKPDGITAVQIEKPDEPKEKKPTPAAKGPVTIQVSKEEAATMFTIHERTRITDEDSVGYMDIEEVRKELDKRNVEYSKHSPRTALIRQLQEAIA